MPNQSEVHAEHQLREMGYSHFTEVLELDPMGNT